MEKFEDLSFSGLVGLIDGNPIEAKQYLVDAYHEIEKQKKIVQDLESKLQQEKSYLNRLNDSIDMVLNHMKYQKPLYLLLDKEILIISDDMKVEKYM